MNPLLKARDGAATAWRKSRDGTTRTAGWVRSGVSGAVGGARSKLSRSDSTEPKEPGAVRDGISGAWDRVGGAALVDRGRADGRIGAALIIGAIVFVLWVAWTVYVWTENGATAGIGVLITWPAVIAALALVAAPFVAAVVLVKRMAADGGPSLAMAGGGTTETAAVKADEPEDEESEEDSAEAEDDDSDDDPDEDED